MCFSTSSSSASKLSLRLCLFPVLNSLFTEMMGVLDLGGLPALDTIVGDDDDEVWSLWLRSAREGFLSTEPLTLTAPGWAGVELLKSMAVASSLSDDCSLFTDTSELLLVGLLFSNGFFKVSRFKFLVGGGRMAGLGWIGFSDPGSCGPWAGRMGLMCWVLGKVFDLVFSVLPAPAWSRLCFSAAQCWDESELFLSADWWRAGRSFWLLWSVITSPLETCSSLLLTLLDTVLILSCANVTWYFNALSLVNFFSQPSLLQLISARGLSGSSLISVFSSSILSFEMFTADVSVVPGFFFFFFFLFFFFLRYLVLWSGASVSADLKNYFIKIFPKIWLNNVKNYLCAKMRSKVCNCNWVKENFFSFTLKANTQLNWFLKTDILLVWNLFSRDDRLRIKFEPSLLKMLNKIRFKELVGEVQQCSVMFGISENESRSDRCRLEQAGAVL